MARTRDEPEDIEDSGTEEDEVQSEVDDGFMYDPQQQNRDEKRELRRNYRQLQEDESLLNANAITIGSLTEKIEAANKLFKKVMGPTEASLDASLLLTTSEVGVAKARQMRTDYGNFDKDEYISCLVKFLGGYNSTNAVKDEDSDIEGTTPMKWEEVGKRAMGKCRKVPVMDFMNGPLSVEQKKRALTQRTQREKATGVEKRPQELTENDVVRSENETTKNVISLQKFLETYGKEINLFKLIVNPESFGQSVENLFYLSFLIRDAKVELRIDETGEPLISAVHPPTEEDRASGTCRKKQLIMELDMETWKQAIEVFRIKKSVLPTRKPTQIKLGNKWYG